MKGPAGPRRAPRDELAAGLGLADRPGANGAGQGRRRRPRHLWPPLPPQARSDHGWFTPFLLTDRSQGRLIEMEREEEEEVGEGSSTESSRDAGRDPEGGNHGGTWSGYRDIESQVRKTR